MSSTSISESISAQFIVAPSMAMNSVKRRVDNALVRYDVWFVVLLAVILALGATIFLGLTVWCVVNQHKRFTGNFNFRKWGLSVNAECV